MTATTEYRSSGDRPPARAGVGRDATLHVVDLTVELAGREVLSHAGLDVAAGEIVGLIGPNGAGKTTFLRAVAGLVRTKSGEVWASGKRLDVAYSPQARARVIAYMPQTAYRHPFTAIETVLMGRYPHLGRFEIEGSGDHAVAFDAMRRTDTASLADRQLDTLSGGERQRVMLARALAQEARVVLLDEPTASLDLKHRLQTMEMLSAGAFHTGLAVVQAVHDLALAARYCSRLVLMHKGRFVVDGTPAEVLNVGNIRQAFDVDAAVDTDPATGTLRVSLLRAV